MARFDAQSGASALLARTAYDPGVGGSFSFTSSTFADADAINLAITFTAPSNGKVLIIVEMVGRSNTSTNSLLWNLREGGVDIANTARAMMTLGAQRIRERTSIGVSAVNGVPLVPGQSYTWKLGAASSDNVSVVSGNWGGGFGPAILEAWRGV